MNCPGVGIVVIRSPREAVRKCRSQVCVGKASRMLVVRIACVGVLEWRLGERKQQTRCDAEME
jgi:hypothetical protein